MHEIFSFRKKLNIKKIAILAIIIVLIIGIIIWKLLPPVKETIEEKVEESNPIANFYSENGSVSLSLSKEYNFTQYYPINNYLLELRNSNNLNIFIAEGGKIQNQVFSEIVSADQTAYIANFNKYSNLSGVSEFNLGSSLAYTYSFHYLDTKTKVAYYLQTIWIEKNDKYYIIDIEFPLDSLNENSKIINDVLNALTIK